MAVLLLECSPNSEEESFLIIDLILELPFCRRSNSTLIAPRFWQTILRILRREDLIDLSVGFAMTSAHFFVRFSKSNEVYRSRR